jgi:hypothetical protein
MDKKNRWKAVALMATGVLILSIYWQDLAALIFSRYMPGNSDVDYGDYLRMTQYRAIISEFSLHPLFGIGLGGYTYEIIRNELNPWMYEGQLLALIMQIGIVGNLALALLVVNIGVSRYKKRIYINWSWLVIFCGWIFACITNPYLLSSLSGIMFWLCKQNMARSVENGLMSKSIDYMSTKNI